MAELAFELTSCIEAETVYAYPYRYEGVVATKCVVALVHSLAAFFHIQIHYAAFHSPHTNTLLRLSVCEHVIAHGHSSN